VLKELSIILEKELKKRKNIILIHLLPFKGEKHFCKCNLKFMPIGCH